MYVCIYLICVRTHTQHINTFVCLCLAFCVVCYCSHLLLTECTQDFHHDSFLRGWWLIVVIAKFWLYSTKQCFVWFRAILNWRNQVLRLCYSFSHSHSVGCGLSCCMCMTICMYVCVHKHMKQEIIFVFYRKAAVGRLLYIHTYVCTSPCTPI